MVCPAGKFRTVVDGATVRAPDGIHYPHFEPEDASSASPAAFSQAERFGAWIEPELLQELGAAT